MASLGANQHNKISSATLPRHPQFYTYYFVTVQQQNDANLTYMYTIRPHKVEYQLLTAAHLYFSLQLQCHYCLEPRTSFYLISSRKPNL